MKINYGKISFVMSLFNYFLLFLFPILIDLLYSDSSKSSSSSYLGDKDSYIESPMFVVNILQMGLLFLAAMSLASGINGLVRRTSRFYSISGIVLNGIIIFNLVSQIGLFSRLFSYMY